MTAMRSPVGIDRVSMFRNDVLPLPVPPATSTFSLARTKASSVRATSAVMDPDSTRRSTVKLSRLKRRIAMYGPSGAAGGITA